MTARKAIKILMSGLAAAVALTLGSMFPSLFIGYDWLFVTLPFGGAIGLVIGYLLTGVQERNSDLEKQMAAVDADLRKLVQDYEHLIEKHERVGRAFIQKLRLHEQVFNAMRSGVLVVGKNGEIVLVNGSALSLLRLENAFTTESLSGLVRSFDVWSGGPISRDRSVARITLQDGTHRLFGFSTSPLEDGSLVVWFQDITVAVESQERKRRSEELALVGEMVSRLSHEIKNPLASILVGVKTLKRDTPQSAPRSHILHIILEEVNSLTTVINQLLESARPRTSAPGPVYIEPLLERCLDSHGFQATRRGVRLEIVRFPVSTVVLVDEQGMLRALGSVIQNALDACSRGDLIRIGWRELDQAGKDELLQGFSGKVVSLFVEDDGAGVPDRLSASETQIFKAFVSTKASGSGLGLTVAQDIVEEHGGVIMVNSLHNRGTRVEILFPIPEGKPCWDRNSDQDVECTSCYVRTSGTGYFCWKQKQGAHGAETGQWPARCLKCSFFRASSLTPFFRSRLVLPKGE